ncbi:putative SUI1 domain superfamily protein [Helianthus anomalus]
MPLDLLVLQRQSKSQSNDFLFGIKLSDASKKLGKKFATGASVVKKVGLG